MNQLTTLPAVTELQANAALDKAVLGLFRDPPNARKPVPSTFLSTIYCSLRQHWSTELPTACTDGVGLWINPDWFHSLSEGMRVTLIAHELWHVAYMHMGRLNERDPQLWNQAADHAINLMLFAHGYIFDVPHLADARFTDLSAEQIYAILHQEQQQHPQQPIELPFGQDIKQAPGDSVDATTKLTQVIVRAVTMSRLNAREVGTLPGDLTTMVDALLNPRLPWEVLLRRWLNERGEQGYNWRRPHRRYAADDLYLPSNGGEEGLDHLMWAFDTSGSMTDGQVALANTEMKGAKDRFNPQHMTVVSFDTKVRDIWEFDETTGLDRLQFTGRGGTKLTDVFTLAAQRRPKGLIVLSDLECAIPPAIPGVPVLWICLDRPTRKVDYGHIIHVSSSDY